MTDSDGLFAVTDLEHVAVVEVGVEAGAGVNKWFRAFDSDAVMLVPPSLGDWLPETHLSRFIADVVESELDLSRFYASYAKARGQTPYDPRLMIRVQLYGYCIGVRSSRKLERACVDVVAFRWLAGQTSTRFIRLGPAAISPRNPVVPKASLSSNRECSSAIAAGAPAAPPRAPSISAPSSSRVSASGS